MTNISILESSIIAQLQADSALSRYVGNRVIPVRSREMVTESSVRNDLPCLYLQFVDKTYNDDLSENLRFRIVGFDTEDKHTDVDTGAYRLSDYTVAAIRNDLTFGNTVIEEAKISDSSISDYNESTWVRCLVDLEIPNVGIAENDAITPIFGIYLGTANDSLAYTDVEDWTDIKASGVGYHYDETIASKNKGHIGAQAGKNVPASNFAVVTGVRNFVCDFDIKADSLTVMQYILKRTAGEDKIKNYSDLSDILSYAFKLVHRINLTTNRVVYIPKVQFSHEGAVKMEGMRQTVQVSSVISSGMTAENADLMLGYVAYSTVS